MHFCVQILFKATTSLQLFIILSDTELKFTHTACVSLFGVLVFNFGRKYTIVWLWLGLVHKWFNLKQKKSTRCLHADVTLAYVSFNLTLTSRSPRLSFTALVSFLMRLSVSFDSTPCSTHSLWIKVTHSWGKDTTVYQRHIRDLHAICFFPVSTGIYGFPLECPKWFYIWI